MLFSAVAAPAGIAIGDSEAGNDVIRFELWKESSGDREIGGCRELGGRGYAKEDIIMIVQGEIVRARARVVTVTSLLGSWVECRHARMKGCGVTFLSPSFPQAPWDTLLVHGGCGGQVVEGCHELRSPLSRHSFALGDSAKAL